MQKAFTTDAIPQQAIDDWKSKYKEVFIISVPESDEPDANKIDGYFRKPTVDELGIASAVSKDNQLKAAKVLYNTCILGGHPMFENDDAVIMASLSKFKDIVKVRGAEIKKA